MSPPKIIGFLSCCLLTTLGLGRTENIVKPSCTEDAKWCEFNFTISNWATMTYSENPSGGGRTNWHPVVIQRDGGALARLLSASTVNLTMKIGEEELSSVITGDGSYKLLMLVNRQFPGPPIVVYQGQEIVVHVTNGLLDEAFTMHWHGMRQQGTPWMDGGGHVSQYPLAPDESFTYRFSAQPVGTHWYHAHEGVQRSQGAFGPLIVLPRTEDRVRLMGDDPLPEITTEFLMTVHDFFHQSSLEFYHQWSFGTGAFAGGYGDLNHYTRVTRNVDGFQSTFVPFTSALVNGKGRHYPKNSSMAENPWLPLEEFTVEYDKKYRFRIINSGLTTYLRVSIDAHALNVIATDGDAVRRLRVDSIVIAPGERYDVYIETIDSEGLGNYWIRADTLERFYGDGDERLAPGHTEAILRYGRHDRTDPVSHRQECTVQRPCRVLNCPFRYYPEGDHTVCLPLTALRSVVPRRTLSAEDGPILEHFLDFHYHQNGKDGAYIATINGIKFKPPNFPLQTDPDRIVEGECDPRICLHDCNCVHIIKLPLQHVVQLVLLITGKAGSYQTTSHPIHMHAHQFEVIKVAWPHYDEQTGLFVSATPDIQCPLATGGCRSGYWTDRSWARGRVPDVNTERAVRKDTVIVPVGGYVVIRFKTDNPGFWFLHCHMEMHNANGMALVMKEGAVGDMAPMPHSLEARCKQTAVREDVASVMSRSHEIAEDNDKDEQSPINRNLIAGLIFVSFLVFALCIVSGLLVIQLRRAHRYQLLR